MNKRFKQVVSAVISVMLLLPYAAQMNVSANGKLLSQTFEKADLTSYNKSGIVWENTDVTKLAEDETPAVWRSVYAGTADNPVIRIVNGEINGDTGNPSNYICVNPTRRPSFFDNGEMITNGSYYLQMRFKAGIPAQMFLSDSESNVGTAGKRLLPVEMMKTAVKINNTQIPTNADEWYYLRLEMNIEENTVNAGTCTVYLSQRKEDLGSDAALIGGRNEVFTGTDAPSSFAGFRSIYFFGSATELCLDDIVFDKYYPCPVSNAAISGQTMVGKTLTGSYTYESSAEDESTSAWYGYTSFQNAEENVDGELVSEEKNYILQESDQDRHLVYEVSPKNANGEWETIRSAPTEAISAYCAVSGVEISGKTVVGEELVGTYEIADEDAEVEFEWKRDDGIVTAATKSYRLTEEDAGHTFIFSVKTTDGRFMASSAPTKEVTEYELPVLSIDGLDNGIPVIGKELIASVTGGTLSDTAKITYRWVCAESAEKLKENKDIEVLGTDKSIVPEQNTMYCESVQYPVQNAASGTVSHNEYKGGYIRLDAEYELNGRIIADSTEIFGPVKYGKEYIVDNDTEGFSSTLLNSGTSTLGTKGHYMGSNHRYGRKGYVKWTPAITKSGYYDVYFNYMLSNDSNPGTADICIGNGETEQKIVESLDKGNADLLGEYYIGKVYMSPGSYLKLINDSSEGRVDYAKFCYAGIAEPRVDNITITGAKVIGGTLCGSYNYYDDIGGCEADTFIEWLIYENKENVNPRVVKSGTKDTKDILTYTLTDEIKEGSYAALRITPKSQGSRNNVGKAVTGEFFGPVYKNKKPYVTNVIIDDKSDSEEKTVAVSYTFNDDTGAAEGQTKFQWYTVDDIDDAENSMHAIAGATESMYRVSDDMMSKYLMVGITPISSSKDPQKPEFDTGETVYSEPVLAGRKPIFIKAEITGNPVNGIINVIGNQLTAKTEMDGNGFEIEKLTYQWKIAEKSGGVLQEISGASAETYTPSVSEANKYLSVTITAEVKGRSDIKIRKTVSLPDSIKGIPSVKNAKIKGNAVAGNVLTVEYDFYDINGDTDFGTVIKWYVNGHLAKTGNSYEVSTADRGAAIYAEIIPKATGKPLEGQSVKTNTVTVSGGGNAGGGGGGGSSSVKYSAPAAEVNVPGTEITKPVTTGEFTDIKGHWAEEDIKSLVKKKILRGVDDTHFEPDRNITRAEFISLILRTIGADLQEIDDGFTDVNDSDWFAKAVKTAKALGLISGDGNCFNPNNYITREEMAKISVEAKRLIGSSASTSGKVDFTDADRISTWASEYVAEAAESGLVQGRNGEFAPKDNATRAECAVIMQRLLAISENKELESAKEEVK